LSQAQQDWEIAKMRVHELEHWAIAEIKTQGPLQGPKNLLVRLTGEAVFILLVGSEKVGQIREASGKAKKPCGMDVGGDVVTWDDVAKLLSSRNFKEQLKEFNVNDVHDRRFQLLAMEKRYSESICHADFNVESVGRAAEGLCSWIRAVCSYKQVLSDYVVRS
jgi:hypothetical protein